MALTIGFGIYSFKDNNKANKDKEENLAEANIKEDMSAQAKVQEPEEPEEPEEIELPVIDLSENSVPLETELLRINEPMPFGEEVLYSAGDTDNIDEPVFEDLYVLNLKTGEETAIAHTEIKFGEIYEGRFNGDWIVWLDTNQSGENQLYVMNRNRGNFQD